MSRARVGIGGGVRGRIGRGLRFRAVYAKLSRVPLNWEVESPNGDNRESPTVSTPRKRSSVFPRYFLPACAAWTFANGSRKP